MTSTKMGLAVGAVFLSAVAIGNATAAGSLGRSALGGLAPTGTDAASQTATVERISGKVTAAVARVRKMHDAAVSSAHPDMSKAICLSDKLNQLETLAQTLVTHKKNHGTAIAGANWDSASHELLSITTIGQRAEQLNSDANQCVGENQVFSGDTNLRTTIDPNIVDQGDPPAGGVGGVNGTGGTVTPTIPPTIATPVKTGP